MPIVLLELGAFVVMTKYIFQKNGSDIWYFRRRIPEDLKKHYPSQKANDLVFSLQTKDGNKAASHAHKKALEQDALWESLRTGAVSDGPDVVKVANGILSAYGLKPNQSDIYKHFYF